MIDKGKKPQEPLIKLPKKVENGILLGLIVVPLVFVVISAIVILVSDLQSSDNMVPTAIVCPSFMNGASWNITKADGGYYVDGSFYSDTKTILAGYRSRAGKDCKFVY